MVERTRHGEHRHAENDRPTSEAENDRSNTHEIYRDIESDYFIFIGPRGRTHVYTPGGQHHSSFRTKRGSRQNRSEEGKWERIERDELPESLR